MIGNRKIGTFSGMAICLAFMIPLSFSSAQWPPQTPSQPFPQQYPPPAYPPPQTVPPATPSPYPPAGPQPPGPGWQMPQPPGHSPQGMPGQALNDVFGRFSLSLPQGSMPMSSNYAFGIPQAMVQVNIMSVSQDQMFQMNLQNFPGMMKQMGGTIDSEQPMDLGGRQGRFIAVTMKNPQANVSFHSMNVFIPGPNVWIQVMGPEPNTSQIGQTLQSILGSLRF
jgi:hypothetical protein